MANKLNGKYTLVKTENLDQLFDSLGLSAEKKDAITKMLTGTLEITVSGNKVTTKSFKEATFELGKEFEESGFANRTMKSVANLEGDKLVVKSKTDDGVPASRVYEPTSDGLVLIMNNEAKNVTAKRFYKRA